jgi:transketolase
MQDVTAAAIEPVRARTPRPEAPPFDAAQCRAASKQMRKWVVQMTLNAGRLGSHAGGAMSIVELLSVLYVARVLRYDVKNGAWEERDRFILSKGHAAPSFYGALALAGFIDEKELETFKKNETRLYGHPAMNLDMGIEFSTGSLGQGLSQGVGTALALKARNNDVSRVFVVLGDGECNEGSVWEAAMCAAHYGLDNVVAIVDRNGMQYDGFTEPVMNTGDMVAKWKSFGWEVRDVADGHDVAQLHAALTAPRTEPGKPLCIISRTVRGKGVSFMENAREWHHSTLNQEKHDKAMAELNGDDQ